jgi:dolichyl-phosphate-mannose--protein O-mannosyl transferase
MGDDEGLEEWNMMAKETVGMYRAVWVEVEHQIPTSSAEERLRICSFISPFINNMFTMAVNEGLMEDLAKTSGKRKKKR